MRVIGLEAIGQATARHPKSESAFNRWLQETERAKWKTSQDIKNTFRSASFIDNNRVIFNIGGPKYRLVVAVKYANDAVVVLMAGSHAEYDEWNRRKK